MKGYITGTRNDEFVLADAKTGALNTIAYNDVEQIKKSKKLPFAAKIAIGTGVGVAVVSLIALALVSRLD